MLESKTKTITHYGILQGEEFTRFPTKKLAIKIGKSLYKIDQSVKLIERYYLWDITNMQTSGLLDQRDIDITYLIMSDEDLINKIKNGK